MYTWLYLLVEEPELRDTLAGEPLLGSVVKYVLKHTNRRLRFGAMVSLYDF